MAAKAQSRCVMAIGRSEASPAIFEGAPKSRRLQDKAGRGRMDRLIKIKSFPAARAKVADGAAANSARWLIALSCRMRGIVVIRRQFARDETKARLSSSAPLHVTVCCRSRFDCLRPPQSRAAHQGESCFSRIGIDRRQALPNSVFER